MSEHDENVRPAPRRDGRVSGAQAQHQPRYQRRKPVQVDRELWRHCIESCPTVAAGFLFAAWLVPPGVPLWTMTGATAIVTCVVTWVVRTVTGSAVLAAWLLAWGIALTGWFTAARIAGAWTSDVIAALVFAVVLLTPLGPPAIAHSRMTGTRDAAIEDRARQRRELAKWEMLFARLGVKGVQVTDVHKHASGVQVYGRLGKAADAHGMATYDSVKVLGPQIATHFRLAKDAAHFEEGETAADFTLHLRTRRGKRTTVYLPEDFTTTTVNKPLELGLHDNGKKFRLLFREIALIIIGVIGAGKALALDTPIATPSGWTTMGEIQPGDLVYDETGRPCRVLAATGVMRGRPCYEVEFSDGSVITADANHQWLVDTVASRRSEMHARGINRKPRRRPDLPGAHWNHSQEHLRKRPEIRTTAQMIPELRAGSGAGADGKMSNFSVRVAAPLQCPDAELPVPPYTLGAWLGDGATRTGSVTSADREIISEIEAEGNRVWVVPSTVRERHASYRVAGLNARLRVIGVLGNKHIPALYLRASEAQRRALLAGLLDTDGYCTRTGTAEFCSTRERLARDVYLLVCSLGYKASLRDKPVRLRGKDCGTAWTVSFTPADKVFRLPRKLARQVTQARPSSRHRYVTAIRAVPSVPVRCIEVDSPGHLYLAGESCIPTHNSNLLNVLVAQLARCEDTLIFAIDLKGGRMARPWIMPWIENPDGVRRPVIDWLATSRREALLMLDTLIAAGDVRAHQGAGGEKITPRRDRPAVVVVVDESAVATGHERQDDEVKSREIARKLAILVETYRSEAIGVIVAAVRGDVETMGMTAVKAMALARIGLRVSQARDGESIFPDDHEAAKALAKITEEGSGLALVKGRISPPAHFYRVTPRLCYRYATVTGPDRPGPDARLEQALGEAYATRWDRMSALVDEWRENAAEWHAEAGIDLTPDVPARPDGSPDPGGVPAGGEPGGGGAITDDEDQIFREIVAHIEDPDGKVNPARKRMREILFRAGSRGLTVGIMEKMLAEESLAVHRNTLHGWLRKDEADGRVRRNGRRIGDPYARWIWVRNVRDDQKRDDPWLPGADDDGEDWPS